MRIRSFLRTTHLTSLTIALAMGCMSTVVPAHSDEGSTPLAEGVVITADVGASYLNLPGIKYGLITDTSIQELFAIQSNHDGNLWGVRVGAGLHTTLGEIAGIRTTAAVKGFYSWHDDNQIALCDSIVGVQRCAWGNIVDDPDIGDRFGISSGDDVLYTTNRKVYHWGVALESRFGTSLLNVQDQVAGIVPKLGLDYRRIDQNTLIVGSVVIDPTVNVQYKEDLDTGYLGPYAGLAGQYELSPGLTVKIDAQAGVYWARAEYDGNYVTSFTSPGFNSVGSLSLTKDRAALVAAVSLNLTQKFDGFAFTLFSKGEWYSWAPELAYDNDDEATIVASRPGFVNSTYIDNGQAWSYVGGARLNVPLN